MPRPQLLPTIDRLLHMRDVEGLSQTQIRDRVNQENRAIKGSGCPPVSRSAVSVALHRAGETGDQRPRYAAEIPWSPIAPEHINHHYQAQLRTWARINRGETVRPRAMAEYQAFRRSLEKADSVVNYSPSAGFHLVARRQGVDTGHIRFTDAQLRERGLKRQAAMSCGLAS